MKRSLSLALVVLLIGSVLASAATLISKQQAEQDALIAVGGGTVTLVLKEKELGKIIWSVDITGATKNTKSGSTRTPERSFRSSPNPWAPQAGVHQQTAGGTSGSEGRRWWYGCASSA